jgi:hypothetical protein
VEPQNGKRSRRPNGHGTIEFLKKENRWRARYTEQTPSGPKRRAVYARTEEAVTAKLYRALGWWNEAEHLTGSGDSAEHVYFVQGLMGGPIKIGTAGDVEARFKAIQACSPVPLRVLHVIRDTGRTIEAKIHRRFALYRLHGEWFENTGELLQYIHELKEQTKEAKKPLEHGQVGSHEPTMDPIRDTSCRQKVEGAKQRNGESR